jgi:hypothetical protein
MVGESVIVGVLVIVGLEVIVGDEVIVEVLAGDGTGASVGTVVSVFEITGVREDKDVITVQAFNKPTRDITINNGSQMFLILS